MQDIVIFGDSQYAERIYTYIRAENRLNVLAFTNERKFITRKSIFGIPVVPFENLREHSGNPHPGGGKL